MDYFSQKLTPRIMDDFFPQSVVGYYPQVQHSDIFRNLYLPLRNFGIHGCYFLLNLYWPSGSLRDPIPDHDRYIISFHTEYVDVDWLKKFVESHSQSKILVLFDGSFYLNQNQNFWPHNVTFLRWISWGHQIEIAKQHFGINKHVAVPEKKISSLVMRATDYKMFVTAYLIKNFRFDQMIISWHQHNFHPANKVYFYQGIKGYPRLNEVLLDRDFQSLRNIRLDDYFSQSLNFPIANANWHHQAYLNAAVNLTNESISSDYVYRSDYSQEFLTPGPYLTEKSWKPLLAGQAFVPVGQPNTVRMLKGLGLDLDFGLDLSFDQTFGGFDRMEKIFSVLDFILDLDHIDLLNLTRHAAEHNLDHIRSGNFEKHCNRANYSQLSVLDKWLT